MGKWNPLKWKGIEQKLESNEFAWRMVYNDRYRIFVSAVGGLIFNVIFAVFNAVVGWVGSSPWFGTLAAYYILLSVMRCYWLTGNGNRTYTRGRGRRNRRGEKKLCRLYGIFFCFMSLVLGGAVILLLNQEGGKQYPGLVIYAVATYTFCKIVFAAINVVRARKRKTLTLMIIRDVGYVDACVSILSLQTAMLAAFGGEGQEQAVFARGINGGTGAAVCLIILGLGIYYLRLPKYVRGSGAGRGRGKASAGCRSRKKRGTGTAEN